MASGGAAVENTSAKRLDSSMGTRRRGRRALLTAAGVLAGLGFAAAPASGAHHLLRISEVYPAASPNEAFVELQLTAANEHLVDSQDVNTYGPTGVLVNSFEFEGNPPNG